MTEWVSEKEYLKNMSAVNDEIEWLRRFAFEIVSCNSKNYSKLTDVNKKKALFCYLATPSASIHFKYPDLQIEQVCRQVLFEQEEND